MTIEMSGKKCIDLLKSANLQLFLESKLRVNLEDFGSPEFKLIWKKQDISLDRQICRLQALVHRINEKDFTGVLPWPTVTTRDTRKYSERSLLLYIDEYLPSGHGIDLNLATQLCVEPEKLGVLNPELPRWLMGYPITWKLYMPTEIP